MNLNKLNACSSNCIAAVGQPARSGAMLLRLLLTIVLSAVCIALLAACGGGSGGGNGNGNGNRTGNGNDNDTTPNSFPSVVDLKIIPAESSLRLSWRNPDRDDISDFNISWVGANTSPAESDSQLTGDNADTSAGAMATYVLDGLTDGIDYTVSVSILYAGGGLSKVTADEMRRPGQNTDNDTQPDDLDPDDDNDGVNDADDNCRLVKNADQTNTDNVNGDGDDKGDACDDDDDNDGVADAADAFRTDACASTDTDGDGDPDTVIDGCRTDLTADSDADNDGFPDVANATTAADNCPSVANADQVNNDGDALGDVCDGDDDNDGFPDLANATTLADNCPLIANADQANTDNATDGGDACDGDDDNDGFPDVVNATTAADNCPLVPNPKQTNSDGANDGGDACDDDDDNDGFPDLANATTLADNCPLIANVDQANTDNATDGGDACDLDDDNDGFPDLANATTAADNCPLDYNPKQANADGVNDGGDECDDDDDNDNEDDATDVDDNGNGLIEIRTLDDLARLRVDLDGNGTADRTIDGITTVGNTGCPNGGCRGYELTRSLNFSDAASYTNRSKMAVWTDRSGRGWPPIGSCETSGSVVGLDCTGTSYTGMFDGQGYTIADLFISAVGNARGVGLFGAFIGSLQNLHLRNVRVHGGSTWVGGLVGYGPSAHFENLSVTEGSLRSSVTTSIGGLVGEGNSAIIRHSYVTNVTIFGASNVGGLIGVGTGVDVYRSHVADTTISSVSSCAGLISSGSNAMIRYSYTAGVVISCSSNVAGANVGGLVALGGGTEIRYSYVIGGNISSGGNTGGLIGDLDFNSERSMIHASYAAGVFDVLASNNFVGGLIGLRSNADINYSYAAVRDPTDSSKVVHGFIGTIGGDLTVDASYWDNEANKRSTSDIAFGRTTAQLQSPDFTGIYADWDNFWCDPNTGDEIESEAEPDDDRFIRAWDLGTADEYPALTCTPGGAERQKQRQ